MLDQSTSSAFKDHSAFLETLADSDPAALKAEAEAILPGLGAVEVIQSRTGFVMQPMRDSVTGTDFHLGEVLVAEAHVRLPDHGVEGYGMVVGRDLERAMAMALLDAARTGALESPRLIDFVRAQTERAHREEQSLLRDIEATRVEMETF